MFDQADMVLRQPLCEYEPDGSRYRCRVCGDVRTKLVIRFCPRHRERKPAFSGTLRPSRTVHHILATHCHPCEHYPCLAEKACQHENRLRDVRTECPRGVWSHRPRWVTTAERTAATLRLAAMLPPDVTAVAGIPRSGLAPAMLIAEALHLHAYTVHEKTGLQRLPHGFRLDEGRPDNGRLVIVDDTVASGKSLESLRNLRREIADRQTLVAVVYASPECSHLVDLYAEILPQPHYLEKSEK